ncbi:cytochrome P450 9e2-like [Diorhabda carinulata]|uniref:cytochrome P450 9e2-like n=1 Tax=Diorhabda carinulata TaxID=1163345 RepID=UPI0025A25199|nr:cytochrome P450 9e2-like [Diorhabda carinulata]
MIHLLLEARKGGSHKKEKVEDVGFAVVEETDLGKAFIKEITNLDIAAQAMIFFFAGFDTVSSLMSFMAYELALHPEIQKRLREEIEKTLEECNGNVTYSAILKMKYMDMVVSESLRKWPIAIAIDRVCTKPYTIQPTKPGEKPLHIEKGTIIWFPIFGIHRDPAYYPDPDRFDPERFGEDNTENIVPYSFLPFGVGPRNCIGSRFALLETKVVFFYILCNFEIVPNAKTDIPIQISKSSFNLLAENGFWFDLKRLRK